MNPLDAVSSGVDIVSNRALNCDDIKKFNLWNYGICQDIPKEQQPTFRPKSIYKDLYGVIGV